MPTLIYLAIAAVSLGGAALVWLVVTPGISQRMVRMNLNRGLVQASGSVGRRARRATIGRVIETPATRRRLEGLAMRAGRPHDWPVDRVLNAKVLAGLAGLLFGLLVLLRNVSGLSVLLAIGVTLFGFFLPDLLLYNAGLKRRQAVTHELPDTLDQMSIAVEAGLAFDAAMSRVAKGSKGVLAEELTRTLQDIQIGQPRRLAYEGLAERCGVPDLRRFVRAVVQAEEYGIALADVLNTQAHEMRVARRQRAERKAMEIPVKVTFPLILFILPALMIVIMGPAVISIIQAFSR